MHILYVISSRHPVPAMIMLKDTNHATIIEFAHKSAGKDRRREKKKWGHEGRHLDEDRLLGLKDIVCTCKAREKKKVQERNMFSNGRTAAFFFPSCHAQHASSFWASVVR